MDILNYMNPRAFAGPPPSGSPPNQFDRYMPGQAQQPTPGPNQFDQFMQLLKQVFNNPPNQFDQYMPRQTGFRGPLTSATEASPAAGTGVSSADPGVMRAQIPVDPPVMQPDPMAPEAYPQASPVTTGTVRPVAAPPLPPRRPVAAAAPPLPPRRPAAAAANPYKAPVFDIMSRLDRENAGGRS